MMEISDLTHFVGTVQVVSRARYSRFLRTRDRLTVNEFPFSLEYCGLAESSIFCVSNGMKAGEGKKRFNTLYQVTRYTRARARARSIDVEPDGTKGPLFTQQHGNNLRISARLPIRPAR